MRTSLVGRAVCRGTVSYYLLEEETAGDRRTWGILVELGEERVLLRDVTSSEKLARSLLEAMCRGTVTPVTARDVVEDWLLA